MKTSRLLLTSSALFLALASCDKSRPGAGGAGGGGSADALAAERAQIEEERLALERQRLEEERAALEEEKDALRAEREARLAMREQELEDDGTSLEERQRQLADRELELSGREDELASREASLSEQELEIAGRDALDGWVPEPLPEMQEPVADYDTFYEDLQPYGSWYETPDYGYVYQPTVVVQDSSWRPYTRGRWACTNLGWNWVSDEPFGWACFHYGRWALLDGRGWVWVPGDEWAPSWVCWREGSEHVGWAPLPPETLCYRGRGWDSSVEAEFGIGSLCFSFVSRRHMAEPLWRHCLPVTRNPDCIRQTNNITNIRFHHDRIIAGGPAYERLRREVGKPWPVYQIESDRYQAIRDLNRRNASVRGSRLEVFAPNLNTPWNGRLKPSRVAGRWDEVKVVRAESGIKPLWSERFRESRVKQKEDAAKTAGPTDKTRQFEENRLKVGEAQRKLQEKQQEMTEARREKQLVRREIARATERPAAVEGRLPSTGKPALADKAEPKSLEPAPSLAERQRQAADRLRETRAKRAGDPATGSLPAGEKESTAERVARLREDLRQREAERVARQTGTQREPAVKSRETPQVAGEGTEGDGRAVEPPAGRRPEPAARQPRGTADDGTAVAENERRGAMEEARRQQQEAIQKREQARNDSEQATRRQQIEETRRQQVEANRQQQEQARQEPEESPQRGRMEEARQQQQEAARAKAEQARQEQADRQRETEAARARQMEEARERQELARREAEENNRRQQQEEMRRQQQEQAREQQEEARRQQQEQARQQQEEMRRQQQQEQARQQQEERARQQEQMREQQEEARRQGEERARQQQEERARQQEQARQQQEERARQQQEEQQRRQEERAREQQERQEEQRQRGR